jgi:hypothetical protein
MLVGCFIAVAAVNAATQLVIVVDGLKSLKTCSRIGEFMNGKNGYYPITEHLWTLQPQLLKMIQLVTLMHHGLN